MNATSSVFLPIKNSTPKNKKVDSKIEKQEYKKQKITPNFNRNPFSMLRVRETTFCSISQDLIPMKDSIVTDCSHRFEKNALKTHIFRSIKKKQKPCCPNCRKTLDQKKHFNKEEELCIASFVDLKTSKIFSLFQFSFNTDQKIQDTCNELVETIKQKKNLIPVKIFEKYIQNYLRSAIEHFKKEFFDDTLIGNDYISVAISEKLYNNLIHKIRSHFKDKFVISLTQAINKLTN